MDTAPEDRMPEAEVALRFAIWLLSSPDAAPSAEGGTDGSAARLFPMRAFLGEEGWRCSESGGRDGTSPYQGIYTQGARTLRVHARPGVGDVIASVGGRQIFAECKGGQLQRSIEGKERANLVRSGRGTARVRAAAGLRRRGRAVPDAGGFRRLAGSILEDTIAAEAGVRTALVGRNAAVDGVW